VKTRCRRRRHEVHVFRDADSCRWVVASGRRGLSRHRTQRTAVVRGIRAAKHRRVDLVIHGRDGRFRSKDSYGNETSRRDTEH
jgi:Uncharacterized protein conserved in bacteria (DUF2188)